MVYKEIGEVRDAQHFSQPTVGIGIRRGCLPHRVRALCRSTEVSPGCYRHAQLLPREGVATGVLVRKRTEKVRPNGTTRTVFPVVVRIGIDEVPPPATVHFVAEETRKNCLGENAHRTEKRRHRTLRYENIVLCIEEKIVTISPLRKKGLMCKCQRVGILRWKANDYLDTSSAIFQTVGMHNHINIEGHRLVPLEDCMELRCMCMPKICYSNEDLHTPTIIRLCFSLHDPYNAGNYMLVASSPFTLILFGASGHLAKQKIYPALFVLALKKRLPKEYAIVGFARSPLDDTAFRALVAESVRKDLPEVNDRVLQEFLSHISYHSGQYADGGAYATLTSKLLSLEKGWKTPVRLAYLSIPPSVFPDALRGLREGNVHNHRRSGDFRCIVEKPVGHDLGSFEDIEKSLRTSFEEEEIFLLDHYLGKEAVRNIYYLRFANPLLERLLKNTIIHHVEITALEDEGIEGRAGYFDAVGTFRDMFQSHLLEMGSLLTMRLREDSDAFQESRAQALAQFYIPPATNLADVVLQGQYDRGAVNAKSIPGYLQEDGVTPRSRANTFAALKLMTRSSRWEGIPFYLRSGKRCGRKVTRIAIQFQETQPVKSGTQNRLDIILQGEAGMRIHLQTKIGGSEPAFRPLILEDPLVCVGDCLPEHGLLLLEALNGRQQWFLSFEEVRTAWRLVDPLQAYLLDPTTPLHPYPAGLPGPTEVDAWIGRDTVQWLP